ncbi:MAG: M48 family metalloprotease [Novosphingobium sp.]
MRRLAAAFALGTFLTAAAPASAAEDFAELRSALAGLQRDDARLLSIGWRLARANAAFCADPRPAVGLLPLDARTFAKPGDIRAALGLSGEFAVQAVAAGSPAAEAALSPGDELLAIDGVALEKLPDVRAGSYSRLAALQTRIEETLGGKGSLELQFKAAGGSLRHVSLKGLAACRSRFELLTGGNEASADGQRVTISRRFLDLARSDDEAAFFVGHELAHNILRHRAWLDKVGRSNTNIRASERAADRLALWLMANAGYDLARAPEFMQRWGKRQANLLFHSSTHDHWKARLILMQAELPKIAAAREAQPSGALDWRGLFPR